MEECVPKMSQAKGLGSIGLSIYLGPACLSSLVENAFYPRKDPRTFWVDVEFRAVYNPDIYPLYNDAKQHGCSQNFGPRCGF